MNLTIYESVTRSILQSLERGVIPWKRPWVVSTARPVNATTGKPYRGINSLLLGLEPYSDPRWLTFKQVKDRGGRVKRGARSTMVVFWKQWEPPAADGDAKARIPLLRQYRVFNAEQCDDLALPLLPDLEPRPLHERIHHAESLVKAMPNPPSIAEGGSAAWYRPSEDHVQMPPLASFDSPEAYYATLLHELGHATGHHSRLNRKEVTGAIQFGSGDYSREELVAELTSAFCCAVLGLDNQLRDNAASYIDGWLSVLGRDPKTVVLAAGHAQRAADYIQGVTHA